ncbi:hypothetical protein BJY16_008553 [Actinoplanes octamycinicus]|uniref:Uncharacterized protein n=1 Tax=Actinoplanes octamycinicus TaxID=135948 RepID=A0A7W7H757_9ACTN|nr:hypothetical protein [Actinoplanes octamycinicus]MBB4745094.1 hypothetical protein [Actinoplanes octamycinicus]GIE55680.1 hypothetical protein Aoc01nite_10820 [Actinoplanes octamycinicus]
MALSLCTDLSAAGWLIDDDQPWGRLLTLGPAGFAAHARLRFIPDPAYPGQHEADVPAVETPPEIDQVRTVLATLARHTGTPDDCYVCVWDGWGTELAAPKVVVPGRAYYLFRGALSDLDQWDDALPDPAFVWPADRAWCLADDVDPHWAGIGGSEAAIADVLATPGVDTVRTTPDEPVPAYR